MRKTKNYKHNNEYGSTKQSLPETSETFHHTSMTSWLRVLLSWASMKAALTTASTMSTHGIQASYFIGAW